MKTIKRISALLVISILSVYSIKAQTTVLPLDSVLARIAVSNPGLQAYNNKVNALNAYARGAKSLPAPQISAGQYQTPYMLNPNNGSFMITAEQTFTNPAKLKAKENYMKGMSAVTEQDKQYLNNQLIAQARQYYYDRTILEKKLVLLQNTRGLLEYMIKDANIRYTYGKEKLNNIYKAKADLFQLDNDKEELNNEIKQRSIMLNILMNRDKQLTFAVDTNIIVRDYTNKVIDTAALAASRSDIKAIDRNIALQQLNSYVEYSKRKPDFGIQVSHMQSYGGFPNQYVLMGSVTIPFVPWASKEYKANLKGIRYEVEELQQQKASILNEADGKLTGLKTEMSSKKQQLNNYNQNIIPALQNNYKTSLLAYEQNTGDLYIVLDALKALQVAKMEALNRIQEILQLQVSYERENEIH
jgi:cobalt-zinc-cadmium efflux system outer membrane protein